MSNCVVRFGGNSLSKLPVLEAFASLLSKTNDDTIVVVSAIPEVVKTIEQGIELLKNGNSNSEDIINQVNNLVTDKLKVFNSFDNVDGISAEVNNLYNLLKGIELTGDFSVSLKDQVISYSELITARILSLFLENKDITFKLLLPEDINLVVTEEFGNASVLLDESANLPQLLTKGNFLIPGSYGITQKGKTARLGKYSADYSAAAIARLVGAEALQLWEIDREFRTADIAFVSDSQLIPRLTYSEASELSYFSGRSIHPRIVEPLISKHIPIHVYRLANNDKELSTIINSESIVSPNVVKSVVHTDEIAVLKLNGPGVGFKPGILAKVTSAFHQASINIRSVITSQVSINIILNKDEIEKARLICDALPLSSVNEIVIDNNVALIAVIGHGMQQHHGVSAKLFTAVAQHKINVLLSGSGASDLVSYLVVDQKDTVKAITEIHNIFFNE
jgi:aspartate kinase